MKTSRRQFSRAACLTCIRLALTTFISIITPPISSSTWSIIILVQKRARLTLANMATAALRILRESLNFSCHLRFIPLSQVSHQSPSSIPELCLFIRNICTVACQGQWPKSLSAQAPCVLTGWGSIMWTFSYMTVLYFASENSLMTLMAPNKLSTYLFFTFNKCIFVCYIVCFQTICKDGGIRAVDHWSGDQMEDYEHTNLTQIPSLDLQDFLPSIKMQWPRNGCLFFIDVFSIHTSWWISPRMKVIVKRIL